jgi:hypothetical protein
MSHLQTRLQILKMIINSEYSTDVMGIYEESYKIRKKINVISVRKYKIKKIFNES